MKSVQYKHHPDLAQYLLRTIIDNCFCVFLICSFALIKEKSDRSRYQPLEGS